MNRFGFRELAHLREGDMDLFILVWVVEIRSIGVHVAKDKEVAPECRTYSVVWLGWARLLACQRQDNLDHMVLSLAFLLNALPIRHNMRISLLAGPIAEANQWLTQLLLPPERQDLPDMRSIREGFLRPLLMQVENDGNARLSEVARRRIGDEVQPATLREIGTDFGVTPDRIRTLLEQAAFILYVRWHEGDYLLQGACARLSARGDATEQRQLLERIHEVLFRTRKSLFRASGVVTGRLWPT